MRELRLDCSQINFLAASYRSNSQEGIFLFHTNILQLTYSPSIPAKVVARTQSLILSQINQASSRQ
jgi:hypothetical protein